MKRKIIFLLVVIISVILTVSVIMINSSKEKETAIIFIGEEYKNNTTDNENFNKKSTFATNNKEYSVIYNKEDYKDLPINYISASYAYDTSSPAKATGVADYSFVAKINGILRTEYRNPSNVMREDGEITVYDPYTVYDVEVIRNIKGELDKSKNIEVVLHGGISEDGESCVFMEGLEFLNVGEYYILLPYTASDGRLGISNGTSVVSLGTLNDTEIKSINETKISTSAVRDNSDRDVDIITTYVEAEKNSVVPENKQIVKSKIYDVEVSE